MSDLIRSAAATLAAQIAAGEVSSVEVTRAHLDQIAATDETYGAFLHVGVGAPSSDQAGQATYVPANRAEVADVSGYNAFRQVAWAGSFEGMTTFGIGVREQLPFKVSVLTEDGRTRLVLDVAHAAS